MQRRIWRQRTPRLTVLFVLSLLAVLAAPSVTPAQTSTKTYMNPLQPVVPGDGVVESCADPSVTYGQEGEKLWYMYCTADPLNDQDRNTDGGFNFHLIPQFTSPDLVNWTYVGDAFATRPVYATTNAGLFAPEIEYYRETGKYHLYYTVTDTTIPGGGSAIGVATSDSPTGPWTQSTVPVIEPHGADCCGPESRRWVFDPEVIRTSGQDYIYYGSYFGGISVRVLSEDGQSSDKTTQKNVAIANKYEGAEVVLRDGYYYLFVSATDCCRGPLSGYSVFVGRSQSPTGPFLDRDGVDLNDNEGPDEADPTNGRAGGTPVITMNGNRWVGPGHNTVFTDFDGQWWTIYHAIDRFDPYFEGGVNIFPGGCGPEDPPAEPDRCGDLNKRPAMLDPIDWVNGWPTLNGGRGPSDTRQPAPAAQPGEQTNYTTPFVREDIPGRQIASLSDEFTGSALGAQWKWVRSPAPGTYGVENGTFRFNTQAADLFVGNNTASVLTEATPQGDYIIETRVKLNVPAEGCCFNFRQAGLVIYGDDDNFIKLAHVSIFNTRQTEFAKELAPVPPGYPRYGNTVVGPPNEWTWLRIVKRTSGNEELYTAYTSRDGVNYVRGGTWTHQLGSNARIGLVSMGGPDFVANFDYVRVYDLLRRNVWAPMVSTQAQP
jgi:arabinan endo-1,5-alpha-L-arabinosidase